MAEAHGGSAQPVGPPVPAWSARPGVRPHELAGHHVRLRPLTEEDADTFLVALGGPGACAPGFTYLRHDPPHDVEEMGEVLRDIIAIPSSWAMAIEVDGRVVGMASYLRDDPAMGTVEVGNILYSPALQRTTAATEAMHLMAAHAFGLGYRRYEWKCDSLNAPSRRAAARLGFVEEGTFRNALVYKGRNRDTTWFSITDDEWPEVSRAHRRWLADASTGTPGPLSGYYA